MVSLRLFPGGRKALACSSTGSPRPKSDSEPETHGKARDFPNVIRFPGGHRSGHVDGNDGGKRGVRRSQDHRKLFRA